MGKAKRAHRCRQRWARCALTYRLTKPQHSAAIPLGKPQKRPGCALKVPHCGAESTVNITIFGTSNILRNKRKQTSGDGIPIVTYSRLPGGIETPEDGGPDALRAAEPWLDGVEVPLVERKGRPRAAAPDIRADADDERAAGYVEPPAAAAADLFEPKRRRSRVLTYVAVLAVVALVAGFGVLALTFHAATTFTADGPAVATDPQTEIADLQKQIDALANSSGPGSEETRAKIAELEARLADIEAAKAPAAAAPAAPVVRTISTDSAPADETPPSPRERPARAEADAVPEQAAEKPPVMELVAPVTSVAKSPTARVELKPEAPASRAKAGGPASDADFIANIEKALADAPPDPQPAASAAPRPAVSAPPPAAAADGVAPPTGIPPVSPRPAPLPPRLSRTISARRSGSSRAPASLPMPRPPRRRRPDGDRAAGGRPGRRRAGRSRTGACHARPGTPGAFDVPPAPGTPVPPEPIPNVQ